jgi:GT2 family glycosyltransferase
MNTRFILKTSMEAELQAFMESQETLRFPVFKNPEVSIVIVEFNQSALTYNCLKSILKTVLIPYEVILIENAPQTPTIDFYNRLDHVRVYANEENLHFIKAANQGAQIARSPYLLFLNNDTVLYPNAVSIAKNTIEESKKVGIVGAKIILFNGKLQEVGCYLFEDGRTKGVGRYENPFQEKYSYTRPVDYTAGAFLFIRKSLFDEVGQFEEDYFPAYYEDVDLCLKVQNLGYEVMVNPDIIIQHLEHGSLELNEDFIHPLADKIEANRIKLIQRHKKYLSNQLPFNSELDTERAQIKK